MISLYEIHRDAGFFTKVNAKVMGDGAVRHGKQVYVSSGQRGVGRRSKRFHGHLM